MRNVSDKRNSEHMFCFQQIFSEMFAVYEIMWENSGTKQATGDNTKQKRSAMHAG
jgi:hypothetical protein